MNWNYNKSDSENKDKALSFFDAVFSLVSPCPGSPFPQRLIVTIASGVKNALLEVFFLYPDILWGEGKAFQVLTGSVFLGLFHCYFI